MLKIFILEATKDETQPKSTNLSHNFDDCSICKILREL